MKKYAIIVAAGTGRRMGRTIPKQFLLLHDKPVLYYTLKAFLESFDDLQIILVLPEEYSDMGKEIIDAYFDYRRVMETFGLKISLVEGDEDNIKITRPVDLLFAEALLEEKLNA